MSDQKNRWAEVAAAIEARMKELGIPDQAELIRLSGLSQPTAEGLMKGEPRSVSPRNGTDAKLCRALQWKVGGLMGLLDGKQPEVDPAATTDVVLTPAQWAARIEERIVALGVKIDRLISLSGQVMEELAADEEAKVVEQPSVAASRKRTSQPQG